MSQIEIRPVAPDDAIALAGASEVMREVALWLIERDEPLWEPAELTAERLGPAAVSGELVLATIGGRPAAAMLRQWEDPRFWPDRPAGQAVFVHRLAVARRHAGAGLGRTMLGWAEGEGRLAKRRFLRLDCAPRAKLIGFYLAAGLQEIDRRVVGSYDTFRFEKRLVATD